MGEWRNERPQVGPLEQPEAFEVEDSHGDTRSVVLSETENLLRGTGSDPGSGYHRQGAKTSTERAAHLQDGLSQERYQAIRSALRTDLQLDSIRGTPATDHQIAAAVRALFNGPSVSFEGVSEQGFRLRGALRGAASSRVESQESTFVCIMAMVINMAMLSKDRTKGKPADDGIESPRDTTSPSNPAPSSPTSPSGTKATTKD